MNKLFDRMPAEDVRAFRRGQKLGWIQAGAFYLLFSLVLVLGFHALGVHP